MIWNNTMELSYMAVGISSIAFLILILVIAFLDGRLWQRMKFIDELLDKLNIYDLKLLDKDNKLYYLKRKNEKLITKLKKYEEEK